MKREEIKAIFPDITDEQLDKVMALHGAEIEKTKAKVTALETELKEKKEAFDNLNTEFETLKTSNASGEECVFPDAQGFMIINYVNDDFVKEYIDGFVKK